MQPAPFKKRVLIILCGMSPQVVTETVFSLVTRRKPFRPTALHIITTTKGVKQLKQTLINELWLTHLCNDYQIPIPEFGENHIHVMTDTPAYAGDSKSEYENQSRIHFMSQLIQSFCCDSATAVHISIAECSIIMGFYAGNILSLYARPQDGLSHILVNKELGTDGGFDYTHHKKTFSLDGSDKKLTRRKKSIQLIHIPFLHLRTNTPLNPKNLKLNGENQDQVKPSSLILNMKTKQMIANGKIIKLQVSLLAFYIWIVSKQLKGEIVHTHIYKDLRARYSQEFLSIYGNIKGSRNNMDRTSKAVKEGMEADYIHTKVGYLKRELKKALGEIEAQPFFIQGQKNAKRTEYGIQLQKEHIQIID